MSKILMMLIFLSSVTKAQQSYEFEVQVIGLRNQTGTVILDVFVDEESFKAEKSMARQVIDKKEMVNGVLYATFRLPAGVYGIAMLDDEDNNNAMRYSRIGIPREGFGFSDWKLKGLKRPKLKDFDFELKGPGKLIIIDVTYY